MKITGFNSIQVVVANFTRSRRFFEQFLGLKSVSNEPTRYVINDDNHVDICVKEIKDAVADPNQPGYHFRHLGFEVESLEQLIDHAVKFGFHCFQMAYDGSIIPVPDPNTDLSTMPEQVIFIRDYDNNLWEFVERDRSIAMLFHR